MNLPLKGYPKNVYGSLDNIVSSISRNRSVTEFYVGRTNNLNATKLRHGCDEIFPIYETTSCNNVLDMEDELIKSFSNHRKCSNDSTHCGGCISEDYINYVYVAVWH